MAHEIRSSNLPFVDVGLTDLIGNEELSPGVYATRRQTLASITTGVTDAVQAQIDAALVYPQAEISALQLQQPAEGQTYYLENHGVIADAGTDGSGTNNQAIIQALINAGGDGDTFVLPAGYTGWSGTITLKNNQRLVGRGYGASRVVKQTTMTNSAYFIKTGALNSAVEDLFIYSATGKTGGIAVGRGTTLNDGPEQTRIRRCKITRFDNTGYWYAGIDLDGINNGAAGYGSRDCLIEDVVVHGASGYGIRGAAVQTLRIMGCDLVSPDFLGGSVSGDLWITGSASYPSNDVCVYSSSLDDCVFELMNVSTIVAGAIGDLYIESNCAANVFISGSISGTITNNSGTATIIVANATSRFNRSVFLNNPTAGDDSVVFRFTKAGVSKWQMWNSGVVSDRLYVADGDQTNGVYMAQNVDGWTNISDARLKENPQPISVLARMEAYPHVQYLHSFTRRKTRKQDIGPLAQQLYFPFPELVTPGEDDDGAFQLDDSIVISDRRLWGVRNDKAGVVALQGVRELLTRIIALEQKLK